MLFLFYLKFYILYYFKNIRLYKMNIIFPDDLDRFSPYIMLIIVSILCYVYKLPYTYPIKFLLNGAVSNRILKNYIFKPLLKNNSYPFIGTGIRPKNAMNCGIFRDNFFDNKREIKISSSYGFPSGHSQSAGYFMAFIHKYFKNSPIIYYSSLIYSIYIPYTRIILNCHTIQQIISGYIFGIITFYLFDFIENKLNKKINIKNYNKI